MWTFFYKSSMKLHDIASQINPHLKVEFTSFIENEGEFDGRIGAKSSIILNNLMNLSAKLGGKKKKKESTEIRGTFDETSFINTLDKFFPKNKYSFIDHETKREDLKTIKKLIYFTGNFKIHIAGNDSFEKIAKFKEQDFIKWTATLREIRVNLLTSKMNYISTELPPTAVAQALSTKSNTISIDGFGTLLKVDENTLEISPLFLGHKFDL